ncbi:hypothetical protein HDU93_000545 [Gonapodya sp. JEL0774]|nr:hypothetical protein HDU93_000545 [Gonapodya sp. JEL0774]
MYTSGIPAVFNGTAWIATGASVVAGNGTSGNSTVSGNSTASGNATAVANSTQTVTASACELPDPFVGPGPAGSLLSIVPGKVDYVTVTYRRGKNCSWAAGSDAFWSSVNQWSMWSSTIDKMQFAVQLPNFGWGYEPYVDANVGDFVNVTAFYNDNFIPRLRSVNNFIAVSLSDSSFDQVNLPCSAPSSLTTTRYVDLLYSDLTAFNTSAIGRGTPADKRCVWKESLVAITGKPAGTISPSPTPLPEPGGGGPGLSTGVIIGIAAGAGGALGLAAFAIVFYRSNYARKSEEDDDEENDEDGAHKHRKETAKAIKLEKKSKKSKGGGATSSSATGSTQRLVKSDSQQAIGSQNVSPVGTPAMRVKSKGQATVEHPPSVNTNRTTSTSPTATTSGSPILGGMIARSPSIPLAPSAPESIGKVSTIRPPEPLRTPSPISEIGGATTDDAPLVSVPAPVIAKPPTGSSSPQSSPVRVHGVVPVAQVDDRGRSSTRGYVYQKVPNAMPAQLSQSPSSQLRVTGVVDATTMSQVPLSPKEGLSPSVGNATLSNVASSPQVTSAAVGAGASPTRPGGSGGGVQMALQRALEERRRAQAGAVSPRT